jgi:hypothetical protein
VDAIPGQKALRAGVLDERVQVMDRHALLQHHLNGRLIVAPDVGLGAVEWHVPSRVPFIQDWRGGGEDQRSCCCSAKPLHDLSEVSHILWQGHLVLAGLPRAFQVVQPAV